MRKIVYTNPEGTSITFSDEARYKITSLEGTGYPDESRDEQSVPFVDGSKTISHVQKPRRIKMEILLDSGNDKRLQYEYRRDLVSKLNPKLGEGSLLYTNEHGTWYIEALPLGPEFPNVNVNEGTQRATVVFHCADPYWKDEVETEVEISTESGVVTIENEGDAETGFELVLNGTGIDFALKNLSSGKRMEYEEALREPISLSTQFGNKRASIDEGPTFHFGLSALNVGTVRYAPSINQLIFASVGKIYTVDTSAKRTLRYAEGTTTTIEDAAYSPVLNRWCAVTGSNAVVSNDGKTWTLFSQVGVFTTAFAVCWSSVLLLFCAVGYGGAIATSPDGETWTAQTSGTAQTINNVCAVPIGLVAVGNAGTILTSTDGVTWTAQTSGTASSLFGIATDETTMCVVGASSAVLTSTDGVTWTAQTLGVSTTCYDIAWCGGSIAKWCIACGNYFITSPNAVTWSAATFPFPASITLNAVAFDTYAEEVWTCGVRGGLAKTSDFSTWDVVNYESDDDHYLTSCAYSSSQERICAIGNTSGAPANSASLRYSDDEGATWETVTMPNNTYTGIFYSEKLSLWCAIGLAGVLDTSPDGENWTARTSGVAYNLTKGLFAPLFDRFVVVGVEGIISSFDGITWFEVLHTGSAFYDIAYIEERGAIYLAAGATLYASFDGVSFAPSTAPITAKRIAYAPDIHSFSLIGDTGATATSEDFSTWATVTIPSLASYLIQSASYAEVQGLLWVVYTRAGAGFKAYYSTDGSTWTLSSAVTGMAYGSFHFLEGLDKALLLCSDLTILLYYEDPVTNVLENFSLDSSFFPLLKGQNELVLSSSLGYFTGALTYRQKYIGV